MVVAVGLPCHTPVPGPTLRRQRAFEAAAGVGDPHPRLRCDRRSPGGLPEGLEDLFLGNLVPDLFVQLGQERPMQPGAFVVGGVESEISRQHVVDAIFAVAAGIEVVARPTARVVFVAALPMGTPLL